LAAGRPRCPGRAIIVLLVLAAIGPARAADETGGVQGAVFFDRNGNGYRERDEPGFANVGVILFGRTDDGRPLYLTARTDAAGNYSFAAKVIGSGSRFTVTTGGSPLVGHLPTRYAPLRTFYVAPDGNDSNPGSRDRPFRTIARAVGALEAGDLVYLRQGVYRETVTGGKQPLSGGASWEQPVVVAGVPGETVVVRPPDRDGKASLIDLSLERQRYIVFDNLVLDAETVTEPMRSRADDGGQPPSYIRVVNCELVNSRGCGAFAAGDHHQFINCRIAHNGRDNKGHGLHLSGGYGLIQGCDIHHNAGWGIHIHNAAAATASNHVIRGNRIHENGTANTGSNAIGLHTGRKNLVYDNLIWNDALGIVVALHSREHSILNNTIYGCRGPGIAIAPEDAENESRDNVVKNNLVIGNRDPNLMNHSKSTVCEHNFVAGNPRFRDPESLDFHLKAGSAAIDAGGAVAEVQADLDGIPRPQGKAYDMGAFEFSDAAYRPTTPAYSGFCTPGKTDRADIGFGRQ
jgi:hypothetical protein